MVKVILMKPSCRTRKMVVIVRIWSCAHCFRIVMQTDADNLKVRLNIIELTKDTHAHKTKLEHSN